MNFQSPRISVFARVPCIALLFIACDPVSSARGTESDIENSPPTSSANNSAAHVGALAAAQQRNADTTPRHIESSATLPKAKATFEEIRRLIAEHYVDGALSEDELWTAAAEGVMARLIQLDAHPINTLLSPRELTQLVQSTQGQIVGVGIQIEIVAGTLVVRGLVPGGPALDSGLQAGDRILGVDGERLTGMSLPEMVHRIRGPEGSKVALYVQRDIDEWTVEIERRPVAVPGVESRALGDQIGYLRLNHFTKHSASAVDQQLGALRETGMRRLVLDLRHCPGGLLTSALDVAELFLAPGTRILSMKDRHGTKVHDAERADEWEQLPMVVLVGPQTASGAEILASALGEHGRALVVGQATLGKGTVEAVHNLSNGWALKLSSARFFSPSGEARHGQGLQPDIPVAGSGVKPGPVGRMRIDDDAALKVARSLLMNR